jgi:hypothetical protein
MDRSQRKAAVSAYKERKAIAGLYAIGRPEKGSTSVWSMGDPISGVGRRNQRKLFMKS